MGWETWEGVGASLLDEVELDGAVDALELAALCGVPVRARCGPSALVGGEVLVDLRGDPRRVQRDVAHELGHWALRRAGEDDSERGADYVAGALLMPRRAFRCALIASGWDLAALARIYAAPWPWLAARVPQVADAVATLWEGRYCIARLASPWEPWARGVPTEEEAALSDACRESGEAMRHGLTGAWLVEGTSPRVVVTIAPT